MLEDEDRQAIVITVFDMLREQILVPFERLLDCLLWELMAHQSVDYAALANKLESLWSTMSETEKTGGMGKIYERSMVLLALMRDDPARCLEAFSRNDQPGRKTVPPEWLKGIIDGGRLEE